MEEEPADGGLRLLPEAVAGPTLVAGVTTRTFGDLRLETADGAGNGTGSEAGGTEGPDAGPLARWAALRELLQHRAGARALAWSRQVHGAAVRVHRTPPEGLLLAPDADGHLALRPGLGLAVTLADCVPVFLLPDGDPAVGLLHAGWRGTAAGILEHGLRALEGRTGVPPHRLRVHLGPAIGGSSYEVPARLLPAVLPPALVPRSAPGPDPDPPTDPDARIHLDLRAALAHRALAAGVPAHRVTLSPSDTRTDAGLHSHRGGDAGRHVAFVVRRPHPAAPPA